MPGKDTNKAKSENDEVNDNYYIVYTLFVFMGVIHFLPATFFVTAHDYWMYKFRNTSSDEVDSTHRTNLQTEFSASVTISTHVSSVLSSFLTLFFGYKLSVHLRLYGSLVVILALYVIAAILIHVDTDSWQTGFFVLTMLIVAGVNGMTALSTLTFFSILYKFPSHYLGSYISGQAVAGIFTSCLQLLSLGVGISTSKSAIVYFWIVIAIIIACLLFMITVARRNDFYRYYMSNNTHDNVERTMMSFSDFIEVSKSIWKSLGVLLFFLWTMNPTHPAITSLIVSEGEGNGPWNDVYFVPVATFVLASVGDYLGRFATIKLSALINIDGIWFVAFSAVRVVIFVPLLMLCNVQPRSHLPVVFSHDYQYIIIMVFFSLGNGILFSIGNLLVPKSVPPEKLEDAYHVNLVWAMILMGVFSFLAFVSVEIL